MARQERDENHKQIRRMDRQSLAWRLGFGGMAIGFVGLGAMQSVQVDRDDKLNSQRIPPIVRTIDALAQAEPDLTTAGYALAGSPQIITIDPVEGLRVPQTASVPSPQHALEKLDKAKKELEGADWEGTGEVAKLADSLRELPAGSDTSSDVEKVASLVQSAHSQKAKLEHLKHDYDTDPNGNRFLVFLSGVLAVISGTIAKRNINSNSDYPASWRSIRANRYSELKNQQKRQEKDTSSAA